MNFHQHSFCYICLAKSNKIGPVHTTQPVVYELVLIKWTFCFAMELAWYGFALI